MTTGPLKGRTAIVSGAGTAGTGVGNGRAAAVRLAEAGAHVALIDIDDSTQGTLSMIADRGGRGTAYQCDVTDPVQAESTIRTIVEDCGSIDILFNNVGIAGPSGTVVDVDLTQWVRCLEVNLTSMLITSRYAIPHMVDAGGGSIVNMSSLAGLRGGHAGIAYATTKGAVLSLTQAMASQHGRDRIRVNAVAPGLVYTPMVATKDGSDAEFRERRANLNLLGSEGTAWDVAEAVVYLSTPMSRWVTGVALPVDAGAASHSDAIGTSITDSGTTK